MPQEEIITLRILHIVFGAVWAGAAVFVAAALEPALRAGGPGLAGPAMGRLGRVVSHALVGSAAITIIAGVALALRLRQDSLDAWFDTGWGVAMLIGFIVSLLALGTSVMCGAAARTMTGGEGGVESGARFRLTARWTAVLTVVGLGTMAAARFV